MTSLEAARIADAKDQPVEALDAYERALQAEELPMDAFLDAAVLYMVCADFGYASSHHLPHAIVESALIRSEQILKQAEQRYGPHLLLDFWRAYIKWAVLGEPIDLGPFIRAAQEHQAEEPVFAILAITRDSKFRGMAEVLARRVREGHTARARYIRSVLQSPTVGVLPIHSEE